MPFEFEIKETCEDGSVITLVGNATGLDTEYWYGRPSEYKLTNPDALTVTKTPPAETTDSARTRLVNSVLDFMKYVYDPSQEFDGSYSDMVDAAAFSLVSTLEA